MLFKLLISSLIIALISEYSKKSSFFGSLIASVPIISVLSLIWIYFESKDIEQIKNLSNSIFWMVIPSLMLFISFPPLINAGLNFWTSLIIAIILTIIFYILTILILFSYGIK
ncbi:MAG: hypothetical protein CMG63_01710 [Candidatus Marinimicrobia bacterium]|nr:hypothetical protein [Candidatus Neomarinimicrobiota bacterium]